MCGCLCLLVFACVRLFSSLSLSGSFSPSYLLTSSLLLFYFMLIGQNCNIYIYIYIFKKKKKKMRSAPIRAQRLREVVAHRAPRLQLLGGLRPRAFRALGKAVRDTRPKKNEENRASATNRRGGESPKESGQVPPTM